MARSQRRVKVPDRPDACVFAGETSTPRIVSSSRLEENVYSGTIRSPPGERTVKEGGGGGCARLLCPFVPSFVPPQCYPRAFCPSSAGFQTLHIPKGKVGIGSLVQSGRPVSVCRSFASAWTTPSWSTKQDINVASPGGDAYQHQLYHELSLGR